MLPIEPNPMKIIFSQSISKRMTAYFSGLTGHISNIPVEDWKTVNAKWYAKICQLKVINEIRRNNKNVLHHNNGSSNTGHETIGYLKEKNIKLMSHSPYFLGLLPNDFFLFSYVKQKMHRQWFSSPQEATDAFQNLVSEALTVEKLFKD